MQTRHMSLAMLNQQHSFPGPYAVRVIGDNTAVFVAHVMQAVVLVVGPGSKPQLVTRQSAQGRHQSVHVTVVVRCAEDVLQIYDTLRHVPGLRFLL